jgi:hypothetical protein
VWTGTCCRDEEKCKLTFDTEKVKAEKLYVYEIKVIVVMINSSSAPSPEFHNNHRLWCMKSHFSMHQKSE